MNKTIIWSILILTLMPAIVNAATYYVSTTGNDNNDGQGPGNDHAWLTLYKATTMVRAGDTVYIRGGTYTNGANSANIYMRYSGTPENRITWKNYNNETVILRGQPIAINFGGQSYITVDGLTVDNINRESSIMSPGVYFTSGSQHCIIQNCTLRYMRTGAGSRAVFFTIGSSYNSLLNSVIEYGGTTEAEGGDEGDLVWVDGSYNLVQGNIIRFGGHDTLLIGGNYNIARNNEMYNTGWNRVMQTADPDETHRHLIEDNIIHDSGDWTDFPLPNPGIQIQASNTIWRRNRIYNSLGNSVSMYCANTYQTTNVHFYHNTVYNGGMAKYGYSAYAFSIHEVTPELYENLCIKNNIFYIHYSHSENDPVRLPSINENPNPTMDDIICVANHYRDDIDPKFVDLANHDFHLQTDSPCINAGTWLTTITSASGSGTSFTVADASYFMDGWGIIEGDIIQLQGQTTTARITSINYDTNIITVNRSLTWSNGLGVSLAYSGSAPDIGAYEFSSEEPPPPECGDGNCDPGETCSSCPQDCSCVSPEICCSGVCSTPACSQNSDCGTDTACTTYTCNSPGTCSASCSSQDITSCINNDGCCPSGCDEGNDNDCGPLAGPVALYHFDEGSGETAADSSGNGNDGTIQGAIWTTGISGGALEFDGVNDYVDCGAGGSLDMISSFTASAWVRTGDEDNGYQGILMKAEGDAPDVLGNQGWEIIYRSNTAGFRFGIQDQDSKLTEIDSIPSGNIEAWHHVACVYDDANDMMILYIDGVEETSSTVASFSSINASGTSLKVGLYGSGNMQPFNGTIDEVRIYDRVLTPEEISEHYNELSEHIRADLNDDNVVDILDLGIVAGDFGKTSGFNDPDSDTNSDSVIDVFDVVFVASRFT